MTFAEKMVLALFSVRIKNVSHYAVDYVQTMFHISFSNCLQMLIFLWMTRSITDDIPGWGVLFDGRAGDGTASVSIRLC